MKNRIKVNKDDFIILSLLAIVFFIFTINFWFPSGNKTIVAIYEKDLPGYKIYYGKDREVNPKPTWLVKAFPPSNELHITDFNRENWRLVKKQISSIKEDYPRGRLETDLLEEILENYKKGIYPQEVIYETLPSALEQFRERLNKIF